MKVFKNFSFWVAVYITAAGLLFILLPIVQTSLIEFKAPNKYFLMGIALVFFISGCRYVYLSLNGRLGPKGPSVTEIRKQALEKIESQAYPAKTAKGDPNPEIRQKALKRLKETTA
ncbi:MAG: hypothetical protein WBB70_16860 [Desulfobacterales bacterium]